MFELTAVSGEDDCSVFTDFTSSSLPIGKHTNVFSFLDYRITRLFCNIGYANFSLHQ